VSASPRAVSARGTLGSNAAAIALFARTAAQSGA
jgi:hypothetical protein